MYRIIGADGREYGPVNADELRRWIAEGRANAQSRVLAGDGGEWRPLGEFPEFAGASGVSAPPPRAAPPDPANLSKCALVGFILSGLGFCCCLPGLPLSIAGLAVSWVGLSRINRGSGQNGRGLAIAGVVLGAIGILISAGLLVLLLFDFTVNYADS